MLRVIEEYHEQLTVVGWDSKRQVHTVFELRPKGPTKASFHTQTNRETSIDRSCPEYQLYYKKKRSAEHLILRKIWFPLAQDF